jgi:glycosyltransferase involved in cell wall biosynthesis
MKIGFIDLSEIKFTARTPFEEPLGGMQSALVYLSCELVKQGHEVVIINRSESNELFQGVGTIGLSEGLNAEFLNSCDCLVSIYCDARLLRECGYAKKLILWTGHNENEPSVQKLMHQDEVSKWDGFVFKTRWQQNQFLRKFRLDPAVCTFIGNAVAPFFINQNYNKKYFFNEKRHPVFYYSSTPFRGLEILLRAFPLIYQRFPESKLKIFSSMKTYQAESDNKYFNNLYSVCRQMQGVEYYGSLPQKALSAELHKVDCLAFPSSYAETSCITLMEAMVSACIPIVNDLGALRETSSGYAALFDLSQLANSRDLPGHYANFLLNEVELAIECPVKYEDKLRQQADFARKEYNWTRRASQWICFLDGLTKTAPGYH